MNYSPENYFDDPTKLFSDLYLSGIFIYTSTKSFFPCATFC